MASAEHEMRIVIHDHCYDRMIRFLMLCDKLHSYTWQAVLVTIGAINFNGLPVLWGASQNF